LKGAGVAESSYSDDDKARDGLAKALRINPRALSNVAVLRSATSDDWVDWDPRAKDVLFAGAAAGLAHRLTGYVTSGMDPDTAVQMASNWFGENRAFTPETCAWAASHYARALGYKAQPWPWPWSQSTGPMPPPRPILETVADPVPGAAAEPLPDPVEQAAATNITNPVGAPVEEAGRTTINNPVGVPVEQAGPTTVINPVRAPVEQAPPANVPRQVPIPVAQPAPVPAEEPLEEPVAKSGPAPGPRNRDRLAYALSVVLVALGSYLAAAHGEHWPPF
jgi:hypothetical protein